MVAGSLWIICLYPDKCDLVRDLNGLGAHSYCSNIAVLISPIRLNPPKVTSSTQDLAPTSTYTHASRPKVTDSAMNCVASRGESRMLH